MLFTLGVFAINAVDLQGMAYGSLAGLEPVTGLYAALAAMVAYAIYSYGFGARPHDPS